MDDNSASARNALWQAAAIFTGPPTAFWPLLTQAAAHGAGGELCVLYARDTAAEAGPADWRLLAHWPAVAVEKLPALQTSVPPALLSQARSTGLAIGLAANGRWRLGLLAFTVDEGRSELVLVVHLGQNSVPEADLRPYLATFPALPMLYETRRRLGASDRDAQRLAQTLELTGRVLDCPDFDQAVLALVNDLATQFSAETVSLSWRAREGLRLRVISHAEKIDRRTEHTVLLEEAQQEALSQRCELRWPNTGLQVVHAHARYARLQQPGHLLTLPLNDAHGDGQGALTLERQGAAFTGTEQWGLRLICDLVHPVLQRQEARTRALPRRLGAEIGHSLPMWLRPQTPAGRRLATGLGAAALAALFVPLPYAIDAGATVKADVMAFVGAPFDGYIESSPISLGTQVRAGDVLFTLATRELVLERANLLADLAQHTREEEKRRSANQLPEMQIAEAQAAQTTAKLQQVEYRLAQAQVRSPIHGVVIEGEPGKSLGGAVRRGETTVRIAALQNLHVEASTPERDISEVALGADARVKLIATPGEAVSMQVTRLIPAASVKDGHNTFPVRLELPAVPAAWRPGMTGVAKIDLGWRPLAWIGVHRLMDFLRLNLWW
ncbi:efflux RND transporter periplasmic adaptor subunit [Sphaerotilus sp.]|uniref:efflux RND transporter periplasmic adaptor subunit n=1 Tax=Sphaerotilus sp. TaxID=2093942 RepID=UPI0034E2AF9F